VEVRAAEGAHLTVVSMQQWDDDGVHLGQHDVLVGRDATVKHVAVTLGGKIVRLSTNVRFSGPGGEANLLGAFFADAGQHQEHRSFIDHAEPRCASNVTYKGALQGDEAHSVWVGDVLVRAAAEGTDSYELNRNLVLTDGARADSVPNLEIETGEIIQAAHASATGRFDDLQLFYLQSRGVPEDEARRLVVRGFFADVIHQIGVPDVQDLLMAAIEEELTAAMYTAAPQAEPGRAPALEEAAPRRAPEAGEDLAGEGARFTACGGQAGASSVLDLDQARAGLAVADPVEACVRGRGVQVGRDRAARGE